MTSESSPSSTRSPGRKSPTSGSWATRSRAISALFTRQDAVEAAWAVVDPVLRDPSPSIPYAPSTWGPPEADALLVDARWHNALPLPHPSTGR